MSPPAAPRGFIASLFHATDPGADSLILLAAVAMVALCGYEGWDVIVQGREFGAVGFASAAGVILGALGGGKKLRDGVVNAELEK